MNEQESNSAIEVVAARHLHLSDLHGISRLGLAAVEQVIDVVEELHCRLVRDTTGGVTGFAYRQVRASTAWVGRWIDLRLAPGGARRRRSTAERETVLAAINGLFGDYLADSGNALAIPMRLRRHGHPLDIERAALHAAIPGAGGKLLVLVHGLCRCDLQWRRNHHDHGVALAHDLGYTPLYLHYNSGRHTSENGRELAALLEALVREWPVPVTEMAVLAHSMGGLVARSACHYGQAARHGWLRHLHHLVFLGTPHHGAPLERTGNWLVGMLGRSPFTAPFARLGQLRSAGITDLRHGNLVDEDWKGRDRFAHDGDSRIHLPLPRGVKCYTIAGTTGRRPGDFRDRLLGDGVIPLDTALGRHEEAARTLAFPKSRTWVAFGVHHLDLLNRAEVYERIHAWLSGKRPRKAPARRASNHDGGMRNRRSARLP